MVETPSASPSTSPPDCPPAAPSTSSGATGPPHKKKKTSTSSIANAVVDFLKEESTKEQERFEASEAKTDRLLGLFEKMVDKL